MIEKDRGQRFVSGIFISREGEIVGKQRKKDLVKPEKKAGISTEDSPRKIIETDFGTVAFSICRDQWSYDPKLRAEIIIHPRAYGLNDPDFGRFLDNWLIIDRATALLSKAYLIGVTAPVKEAPLSDIISFEGEVLAMREDEGIITASIDLDLLRRYRNKDYISEIVPKF
jgi:predicted amidohydrolase